MTREMIARGLLLTALAAPTAGCFLVTTDDELPGPSPGTLTVAYTIEGVTDPALCRQYRVSDAELVVYSSSGLQVASVYQPCPDFHVGTRLFAGLYHADVTLVDRLNRARTVTKPLEDISVISDTEAVIDVDFPADSML